MPGDVNRRQPSDHPVPVGDYLRDVEAHIPRWRRARRLVLAELADGLIDATQHYLDRGEPQEQAVTRAIRDSGPARSSPPPLPTCWPPRRRGAPRSRCC